MTSDKKDRGFRFFFWVSASLFVLAAANWIFNTFIGISNLVSNSLGFGVSNATSYLLGVGILLLAILFVAAFLNLVYNAVPDVRDILNGVLGLGKESEGGATSPAEGKKGKRTTYAELVKDDPRIQIEDIALLFSSEVEAYASSFTFQIGLLIGAWIALPSILVAGVAVGSPELLVALAKLALVFAAIIAAVGLAIMFFRLVLPRYGRDPHTVRMKRFKEYLDAKDAIIKRDKKNESGGNS